MMHYASPDMLKRLGCKLSLRYGTGSGMYFSHRWERYLKRMRRYKPLLNLSEAEEPVFNYV